ncbi:MAG: hypothetical protein ABR582_01280 [Gemmatimonadaceae bacterium]
MRFRVLVPVVLFLFACTERGDETRPSSASDSSEVVTELSPSGESTAIAKQRASAANASSNLTSPKPASRDTASTVASTASKQRPDYRCGMSKAPVLTSLGAGNLEIGRTIAVVKETCRVIRDEDEMNEAGRERILTVMIGDDPIRVTVLDGLVWRISVRSPRFETRDGLRVGTTLSRLTSRGGVRLFEGEDGLYVTLASHCGLSFRFGIPSRENPGKAWTVAHVVQRHGSAVADRILVTRCAA